MKFYLTLDVTELDPGDRADLDLALTAAANVVNLTVRDPTQWAEALVGLVELAVEMRAPGARALAAAALKDDRLQRAEFPTMLAARLREVAEPRPCSGLPDRQVLSRAVLGEPIDAGALQALIDEGLVESASGGPILTDDGLEELLAHEMGQVYAWASFDHEEALKEVRRLQFEIEMREEG